MKFKVGDRVRFLNEQGGGVISKVISSKMVHVTIEDGFDIPTLASELIRVEEGPGSGGIFSEPVRHMPREEVQGQPPEEDHYEDRETELLNFKKGKTYPPGIYLAYIPQEQKWLITGLLDIYLINHSDYDVLFNLITEDGKGKYFGCDWGSISPRSKILIETIEREQINDWTRGIIQLMFQKGESKRVILPVHTGFSLKPSKLYKEANYHSASFISDKALMLTVFDISNAAYYADTDRAAKEDMNKALVTKASQAVPEMLIDRHKLKGRTAEVDLHISALEDDYSGLSSHEILKIQTGYFTSALESALRNHYTRVFFIHGIGNGVLKNAILDILGDYGGVEYRDAPLAQYGTGAVEVLIRENE